MFRAITSLALLSTVIPLKAEAKISNSTESSVSAASQKVPGCYIVSFNESAKNASKAERTVLAKAQSDAKFSIQSLGKIKQEYSSGLKGYSICGVRSEEKLRSMLKNNPHVKHIEQDIVLKASGLVTVNNPASWGLDRIDQRGNVLDGNFTYDTGSSPVNVYVIDSGIRISHEQFQGRASYGYNVLDNNFNSFDCDGHGTHVAGTIGGKDYGVCRTCSLIAVKVLDCTGSGTVGGAIAAIDWVIRDARAK
jgi:subtilisin family serine protease